MARRGLRTPYTVHKPEEVRLLVFLRISRGKEAERRPQTKTRLKTMSCSESLPSVSISQLDIPTWLSPSTSNSAHGSLSPTPTSVNSLLINLTLTGAELLTAHPIPCRLLTQVPVPSPVLFPAENNICLKAFTWSNSVSWCSHSPWHLAEETQGDLKL